MIAVDGTLTVSDGRALRAQLASLGKPLLGVFVTHAHPDHYGGIGELIGDDCVPVFATAGPAAAIRRDDPVNEAILRPMFGDDGHTGADSRMSLYAMAKRLSWAGRDSV